MVKSMATSNCDFQPRSRVEAWDMTQLKFKGMLYCYGTWFLYLTTLGELVHPRVQTHNNHLDMVPQ